MKKNQKHFTKLLAAFSMLVLFAFSFASAPLQAAEQDATNFESVIACNESLAIDAAKNHPKVKDCITAAQLQYPGRVVSINVTSTPTCVSNIRGCTYTIYISLSFPCPNPPFCLAGPDILIATATISCMFDLADLDCHV